jgi:hypothetical protein
MRVALVLLAMAGCAKQAAERPASSAVEPKQESAAAADTAAKSPPPPPAPTGGGEAPKLNQQAATDQARTGGMLGPTDNGSAFEPLDKSPGKGAAPHGTVEIADSNVKNEVLMDKLHTALADATACYDATLEKLPLVKGTLTLQFSGTKVSIAKSTLKNVALGKCVLDAIKKTNPDAKATITLAFKPS